MKITDWIAVVLSITSVIVSIITWIKTDKKTNAQIEIEIKKMIDESFLLDYLVLDSINKKDTPSEKKKEVSEKIVGNMVEKIMHLDSTIDEEKLKEIVGKQYSIIKYKTVVNEKQIEKIYKKYIDKYLEEIAELKI